MEGHLLLTDVAVYYIFQNHVGLVRNAKFLFERYPRMAFLSLILCFQRGLTCIWCPHPTWIFTASAQCRSRRRTFTCGMSIMPEWNWSCGLWVHCAGMDETLHALPSSPEGKIIFLLHSTSILCKGLLLDYTSQMKCRMKKDILVHAMFRNGGRFGASHFRYSDFHLVLLVSSSEL